MLNQADKDAKALFEQATALNQAAWENSDDIVSNGINPLLGLAMEWKQIKDRARSLSYYKNITNERLQGFIDAGLYQDALELLNEDKKHMSYEFSRTIEIAALQKTIQEDHPAMFELLECLERMMPSVQFSQHAPRELKDTEIGRHRKKLDGDLKGEPSFGFMAPAPWQRSVSLAQSADHLQDDMQRVAQLLQDPDLRDDSLFTTFFEQKYAAYETQLRMIMALANNPPEEWASATTQVVNDTTGTSIPTDKKTKITPDMLEPNQNNSDIPPVSVEQFGQALTSLAHMPEFADFAGKLSDYRATYHKAR
ncbi:MAG: hypothetical protein SFT92_01185 [Rickettsiales bacterium]|nr:hypothetical protein [Rickettsiales bacterium]